MSDSRMDTEKKEMNKNKKNSFPKGIRPALVSKKKKRNEKKKLNLALKGPESLCWLSK